MPSKRTNGRNDESLPRKAAWLRCHHYVLGGPRKATGTQWHQSGHATHVGNFVTEEVRKIPHHCAVSRPQLRCHHVFWYARTRVVVRTSPISCLTPRSAANFTISLDPPHLTVESCSRRLLMGTTGSRALRSSVLTAKSLSFHLVRRAAVPALFAAPFSFRCVCMGRARNPAPSRVQPRTFVQNRIRRRSPFLLQAQL